MGAWLRSQMPLMRLCRIDMGRACPTRRDNRAAHARLLRDHDQGSPMTQRRAFQCPNHAGSPRAISGFVSAVGELLPEQGNPIRCDFLLLRWRSVVVGKDKKGESIYEHTPDTEPGCGGLLRICAHGLRVCDVCPPQFTPTTDPAARAESLAQIIAREAAEAARRKQATKDSSRRQESAPAFTPPRGKVQLPFLGDGEPTRHEPPPKRRTRKS